MMKPNIRVNSRRTSAVPVIPGSLEPPPSRLSINRSTPANDRSFSESAPPKQVAPPPPPRRRRPAPKVPGGPQCAHDGEQQRVNSSRKDGTVAATSNRVASGDIVNILMAKLKEQADRLDIIRSQAFSAVTGDVDDASSILHGMIEEVVVLFRESMTGTIDGINALAGEVILGHQAMTRLEEEKKVHTINEMHVEKCLDRIDDLEDDVRALKHELELSKSFSAGLEKQLEMVRRHANGSREGVGKQGGPNSSADVIRQVNEVMEERISPVEGNWEHLSHQSHHVGPTPQAVNIKPFSSAPPASVPMKNSSPAMKSPSLEALSDPRLHPSRLFHRLKSYLTDNKLDKARLTELLDVNGDGYLSLDELHQSLQPLKDGLGIEVDYAEVLVLHKFLAKGSSLASVQDLLANIENPPVVEHRHVKVKKNLEVIRNIDLSNPHHKMEELAGTHFSHREQEQKKLGTFHGMGRRRSEAFREEGWDNKLVSKVSLQPCFGNVFEVENDSRDGSSVKRRSSSVIFAPGDRTVRINLPPCNKDASLVFLKISSYIKSHGIMMQDVMKHMNVHDDGFLPQNELKKQIITKIGYQLSAAESNFIFNYLRGLGLANDEYVDLKVFEAAVAHHKPPKGKMYR